MKRVADFNNRVNLHDVCNTKDKIIPYSFTHWQIAFDICIYKVRIPFGSPFTSVFRKHVVTLSGSPGVPICEGFSLPLATSIALILAATAAAASRAPVGADSASPIPPEPGPGWSHLLRRLVGQNNVTVSVKTRWLTGEKGLFIFYFFVY